MIHLLWKEKVIIDETVMYAGILAVLLAMLILIGAGTRLVTHKRLA